MTTPASAEYRSLVVQLTTKLCERFHKRSPCGEGLAHDVVPAVGAAFGEVVKRRQRHREAGYVSLLVHMLAERLDVELVEHGVEAVTTRLSFRRPSFVELVAPPRTATG